MKVHYACDGCKKIVPPKDAHLIIGSKGRRFLCPKCFGELKNTLKEG